MCLKIPYVSRADAQRAAQQAPGGQRAYDCPHCAFWHLSSKSRRQVKLARKHSA